MTPLQILFALACVVAVVSGIAGFIWLSLREVNVSDHDDDDFMRPME